MTDSQELVPVDGNQPIAQTPANLFGTADPGQVIALATQRADALADVIRAKHLYRTIGQKNHVFVEAWTMLGSMLGVFPVVVWTRKLEKSDGWEARVEARTLGGQLVGAAEAQCDRGEKTWKTRDEYALRAMAQTRATSRALRGPLGFIVTLAGYEATGAEEMPTVDGHVKPPDDKKKVNPRLHAKLGEADKKWPRPDGKTWEDWSHDSACADYGVGSRADLSLDELVEHEERAREEINRVRAELEAAPFS